MNRIIVAVAVLAVVAALAIVWFAGGDVAQAASCWFNPPGLYKCWPSGPPFQYPAWP